MSTPHTEARVRPAADYTRIVDDLTYHYARPPQAEGKVATGTPEILFVCVHNSGRSQMAAALAKHLSAGKVHVRSAGSQPDRQIHPLTIQALAERGSRSPRPSPNR